MPPLNPLILCVDDDCDDLLFITSIIAELDPSSTTIEATNGKEALSYLNDLRESGAFPDLILLDLNMPLMNGKEFLVRIKADPVLKNIPVVVFTTSNTSAERLYCAIHNVEMVTKPTRLTELQDALKKLLNKALHC